jgi:hypothetical protein
LHATIDPRSYVSASSPFPVNLQTTKRPDFDLLSSVVRDLGNCLNVPATSATSGVIRRDLSASLHGLPDNPQNRKKSVSRDLANMWDEDFRLLYVLARRLFESPDQARA